MTGMAVWLSTTLLGLGTVIVGLICLIIIVKLMSFLFGLFSGKRADAAQTPTPAPAPEQIENRQQFVAAVSAAVATSMGTNVSGLRITSIKKVK